MMKEKHWLIIYDIRDTKRLAKISRCVESFGWRVQKSVFESILTDESLNELKKTIKDIMNEEEDFVLFFEICERDFQKKQSYGKNANQKGKIIDEDYAIL